MELTTQISKGPLSETMLPPAVEGEQISLGGDGAGIDRRYESIEGLSPTVERAPEEVKGQSPVDLSGYKTIESLPEKIKEELRAGIADLIEAKEQEIDKIHDSVETLREVGDAIAPRLDYIVNGLGLSPARYIENLIEADDLSRTNPAHLILSIMGTNNITVEDLEAEIKPFIKNRDNTRLTSPIMERLERIERKLGAQGQRGQSFQKEFKRDNKAFLNKTEGFTYQDIEDAAAHMKEFYSQTDRNGNRLYPQAERYYGEIVKILGEQGTGDLDQAYDMAIRGRSPYVAGNELKSIGGDAGGTIAMYGVGNSRQEERQALINLAENIISRKR